MASILRPLGKLFSPSFYKAQYWALVNDFAPLIHAGRCAIASGPVVEQV
jgi:hypothetical protein